MIFRATSVRAWSAAAGVAASLALNVALALPHLSPAEVVERIGPAASCERQVQIGLCWCGPVPCGRRVVEYVPAVLVETTRGGGESLVAASDLVAGLVQAAGMLPGAQTRQTHAAGRDSTFEAHVYSMPERLVQLHNGCNSCRTSSAQVPVTGAGMPTSPCGNLSVALEGLAGLPGSVFLSAGTSFALHYASELDLPGWRTGCHDLLSVALTPAAAIACGAASLTGGTDPTGFVATVAAGTAELCIGRWGPLRPRQMRSRGPDEVLASAVTAYRALSLAREVFRRLPWPVDTQGLFQQVYPAASACLPIGQSTSLPADVLRSPDGAYAWLYWRPTTCCIPFDLVSNC
jgi:hypothetical protein